MGYTKHKLTLLLQPASALLVDSCRTASETVIAFLAMEALITARLTDNFNLLVQVIESLNDCLSSHTNKRVYLGHL
jgi:hypothetical protein